METQLTLQSQAILWWPCSVEEYQETMMILNHVAAQEGIYVETQSIEGQFTSDDGSSLPVFNPGMLIRVWEVTNTSPPEDDDVLSTFKTRLCDDHRDDQDGEEEICSICLEDLYRGSVTTLHCRHEFHPDCIRRWLVRGQNFCPLCKAPAIR